MAEVNHAQIEDAIRLLLEAIGENPNREGLLDTPKRVAKMYAEVFSGMNQDPKEYFETIFSEDYEELVLVKDIPFYSMCEHHLVPFYGRAHVAYIPQNGRVTGLSKLARAVESVAKRPQLQERITSTVADSIMEDSRTIWSNGSGGSRTYVYDNERGKEAWVQHNYNSRKRIV